MNSIDNLLTKFFLKHDAKIPLRWAKFLAYYYPDARVRKLYLKYLGVQMGKTTFANFGLKAITDGKAIEPQVVIGERVSMGPNISFICESSPNNSSKMSGHPYIQKNLLKNEKIIIEDDVWIGANVTILPGVVIGECSIVGAGAVVNKSVPPNTIVAGIPARPLRTLSWDPSLNNQP